MKLVASNGMLCSLRPRDYRYVVEGRWQVKHVGFLLIHTTAFWLSELHEEETWTLSSDAFATNLSLILLP